MSLTYDDIHRLIREPSPQVRGDIAEKVAESYNDANLTVNGNKIAVDIFRLLLQDTEKHVRKVLANKLHDNPNAPHDIIKALAHDVYEIAEDVLKFSDVLQESDLLELINLDSSVQKLMAISQRRKISERVSNALIGTQHEQVLSSLLGNKGADISESAYAFIVSEYEQESSILEVLVCRGNLSSTLAEKVYSLVADKLKQVLTKRFYLPRTVANQVLTEARENAILKFISPWMTEADIVQLVDQMHARGRLTHSMIIRALCIGEITFFEASVAKRANIPLMNVRKLLCDPGDTGFYALYRSSSLPKEYREAVHMTLKIVHNEMQDNRHRDSGFELHLVEKIREYRYDVSVEGMEKMVRLIEEPDQLAMQA
ncbi:MAG: DUF2336 domain-containing protein [Sphaerospermopsis sp. SIO1G2]|nr:DUF2336 domain-containing protein [Sphaerospermopsis sp. SIO1G2]